MTRPAVKRQRTLLRKQARRVNLQLAHIERLENLVTHAARFYYIHRTEVFEFPSKATLPIKAREAIHTVLRDQGLTLPEIALLTDQHHTTVLASLNRFKRSRDEHQKELYKQLVSLNNRLILHHQTRMGEHLLEE